jgi:hypothetical protein
VAVVASHCLAGGLLTGRWSRAQLPLESIMKCPAWTTVRPSVARSAHSAGRQPRFAIVTVKQYRRELGRPLTDACATHRCRSGTAGLRLDRRRRTTPPPGRRYDQRGLGQPLERLGERRHAVASRALARGPLLTAPQSLWARSSGSLAVLHSAHGGRGSVQKPQGLCNCARSTINSKAASKRTSSSPSWPIACTSPCERNLSRLRRVSPRAPCSISSPASRCSMFISQPTMV